MFWKYGPALLGLALAVAAVALLHDAISSIHIAEVANALAATPMETILLGILATAISYCALAFYDVIAVWAVAPGKVSLKVAAGAGAAGYAISNALGFPLITGGSVRYRIYAAEGLSRPDIGRVFATSWIALWMAFAVIVAAALVVDPHTLSAISGMPAWLGRVLGVVTLLVVGGFVLWLGSGRRHLRIHAVSSPLPNAKLAVLQIVTGVIDVAGAAATLWIVLPADTVPGLAPFTILFVVAIVLGIVGHTPGGVGVFEATIITGLALQGRADVIASLLVFRAIYTVLPFALAVLGYLLWEVWRKSALIGRLRRSVRHGLRPHAPAVISLMSLVSGLLLLGAAATRLPAPIDADPAWAEALPDVAYVAASVCGVLLVITAHGLAARNRRAWLPGLATAVSAGCMAIGSGFADWVAIACFATGIALASFRDSFSVDSGLVLFRLPPAWLMLLIGVLAGFAYAGGSRFLPLRALFDLHWSGLVAGGATPFLSACAAATAIGLAVVLHSLPRSPSAG